MKVSVLIMTYNQEGFIAQAVTSALMQEVNFDYEIVIGEDASTDRTREIVLEFQEKYPGKVRALLRDSVDAERDRAAGVGGKGNVVNGLKACKGQYVAMFDGDDYWTDVRKLQKQVDLLDSHPDFAICCHDVRMFYEDSSKEPTNLAPAIRKEVFTLEDLLLANVVPPCSVLFRRGLFREFPPWFYTLKLGDWPMHIINAQHGKVGYINEVMAAYRFHSGGFWSAMSPLSQGLEIIKMLQHFDAYLGFNYKKQIRAGKAAWYLHLAEISYRDGDRANTRRFLRQYCLLSQFRDPWKVTSLFLRGYLPGLYRGLRNLRNRAQSNGTTSNSLLSNSKDSKG